MNLSYGSICILELFSHYMSTDSLNNVNLLDLRQKVLEDFGKTDEDKLFEVIFLFLIRKLGLII